MSPDIQAVKLDLIQWLAGLQDPAQVLKILDVRQKLEKEYGEAIKPMTKEELLERAKISFKDYEAGNLIDLEELEKKYL